MIKVMRTYDKKSELLDKSEINPINLFIVSPENCGGDHMCGDLLTSDESDIKFAIIGRSHVGSKLNNEGVRTGLILLIKHIKNLLNIPPLAVLIDYQQFRNDEEIEKFVCIFIGVLSLMLDDNIIDSISLVITDCPKETNNDDEDDE